HDAFHHLPRRGNRNGEAYAHAAAGARVDGGVDAQQVAMDIDQRTTRIARVDGRIRLDEIFKGVDPQFAAPQRGDDAAGDRLPHAKGIAYGQHAVAHGQLVRIAQHDHRQLVQVDLEDREIGLRVGAYD